jgi:hypothetical protein
MTGPRERVGMLSTEGIVDRLPEQPARRLADRYLDEGRVVAQEFAGQDRLDPHRPALSVLVAEALAAAERRGEQRAADDGLRARLDALIEQRTNLRDERVRVARKYLDEGNLQPAASELAWAAALDEQLGALQVLILTEPAPEPAP